MQQHTECEVILACAPSIEVGGVQREMREPYHTAERINPAATTIHLGGV